MKAHILLVFITLLFSPNIFSAVAIGEKATDFSLQDSNGNTVSLSDFKGKNIVLEWTNHKCPFVEKHYKSDNMQSLQKDFTDKDVVWLSIVSSAKGKQGYVEGKEANEIIAQKNASPTHLLLDPEGDVGKLFGAKTTPHMYIINKKGELAYKGAIDSIASADPADTKTAENYVDIALSEMLTNKAVTTASTRPYGCSVKYK